MPEPGTYIEDVGAVSNGLSGLGLTPILVGGMALVILGSQRVTRDFDFVIAAPGDRLEDMIDILYERGLELVSRLSDNGEVVSTIANRRIAGVRLRLDAPSSVYFFNPKTGLRIDLLFDFPIAVSELARGATKTTVQSQPLRVASERDLLRLKRIAAVARSSPGDAQDISFLEAHRKRRRKAKPVNWRPATLTRQPPAREPDGVQGRSRGIGSNPASSK